MKNKLLLTSLVFLIGIISQAQVSGVYTIPGAEFPTIASAIAALNAQGVGGEGAVFNVTAGYTETFSTSSDGIFTTTSSNASKQIIFQKEGNGPNPLVIAGVGSSGGTPMDAVFAFGGTDYVTFDGINIKDNPDNLSSWPRMETGFWLAKASDTDGTQHITIKNCKIFGFYKTYLIASSAMKLNGVAANATSFSGTNSYNKVYSDSLVNTDNSGSQLLYLSGSSNASTTGFFDLGNEIGAAGRNVFINTAGINCLYQHRLVVANNLLTSINNLPVFGPPITTQNNKCPKIFNNEIGNFSTSSALTLILDNFPIDSTQIYNNYIHDITGPANATTQSFIGISTGASAMINKVYGNQITNITWGGASTTSGTFTGILLGTGAAPTGAECHVYNNTLSGNVITSSSASNVISFIFANWYGSTMKVYNNTITGNTTNCNGTTNLINGNCLSNIQWAKYIYDNIISNHTNTGGTLNGIYHLNSLRTYIYRNKISGLSSSGTSAVINGIKFDGGTFGQIYNNYIFELYTPASSGARQITGINISAGSSVAAHYNTIYLDASSIAANFGTAGIYAATSPVVALRNNIVFNGSLPSGTGLTVALQYGGTSRANYDIISDNNNYYAGIPDASHVIYYDGTNNDQELQSYQIRAYPAEQSAISENTQFVNVTTHPYDMHMYTNDGSQCESAGTIITSPDPVLGDFYNTPRYPNPGYPADPSYPPVRPDIGAEEFAGIFKVKTPPHIAMTPLKNTASTTARTLATTITDLTGVPTSGSGLPVLYWNVNNGSWNSATGVFLGNNQYLFTFGDGVSLNDSIKYYIVAQNLNSNPIPNIGSTPLGGSGFTLNPPAASTPPSFLFAYKIIRPACGTYMVGTGGDYPTLSAAIGDLNTKEISCPVKLLLIDAVYASETFPIQIDNIPGLSPVNTLTIMPGPGVNATVQGSIAGNLILFNGARYVTIDGSNNGTNTRNLTLWNSNSTTNASVIYFGSAGDYTKSASYDVIKNCNIRASSQVTNVTYGINCNAAAGGGYSNLVIENNAIYSVTIGVKIAGTATYPALNCEVLNNVVGTPVDSTSNQLYGIYVAQADNTLIQGNEVIGASQNGNGNNNISGIRVYTLATNTKVKRNIVHGLHLNGGTGYVGPWGIFYRAEASSVTEISNNIVYDIQGVGGNTAYYSLAGISVQSGGYLNIWNNSISLDGICLLPTTPSQSACIVISPAVAFIDVRNNILRNNLQTTSGVGASVYTYGIFCQATAKAFTALDYNDYFVTGNNPNIGGIGSTTINCPNLGTWQATTGLEGHSLEVDPVFTSELRASVPALNNAGVDIPEVTIDFAGVLRTNPPDIGAFEFNLPITAINTLPATSVGEYSVMLNGDINTAGEVVDISFEYGPTNSYGTVVTASPATVRSIVSTAFTATLTGLTANSEYHFRAKGISTTSAETVYGADLTFTTNGIPENITIVNAVVPAGKDTCFDATQTITIAGNGTAFVVQNGGSVTMIAGHSIIYLPGTSVEAGGYLHGYITESNAYCGALPNQMNAGITHSDDISATLEQRLFRMYPNPTTGTFTLEITGANETEAVNVEIFGMRGDKVLKTDLAGNGKYSLSLANSPTGIYFVRIISGGRTETAKIIRQ